jgi:hypothetical protein
MRGGSSDDDKIVEKPKAGLELETHGCIVLNSGKGLSNT